MARRALSGVGVALIGAGSLVPAQTLPAGTALEPARIQLGELRRRTDATAISLTPIVRIIGPTSWATGTLLQNCRLITALHPLIEFSTAPNTRSQLLRKEESLIGQRFRFETVPLPRLKGKKATGHFRVIAHGKLYRLNLEELLDEDFPADWAVGYDEECLSERHDLGFVRFRSSPRGGGESFLGADPLVGYVAAGYSRVPAAGAGAPAHPLYVDSDCGVEKLGVEEIVLGTPVKSNCSAAEGAAGQLMLRIHDTAVETDGRRQLFASGMFERPSTKTASHIPNVQHAWFVQPFATRFYGMLKPHLEGVVDFRALLKKR